MEIFRLFSTKEMCRDPIVHQLGREAEAFSTPSSLLAHFLQFAAT